MAGDLDDDLETEGYYLDSCYFDAGGKRPNAPQTPAGLHAEFFADSADRLLSSYERVYSLPSTGSAATRRLAIQTAMRSIPGQLNVPYFLSLGTSLGYTITISEGSGLLFVVADTSPPATQLPAPLFSPDVFWTWTVNISTVTSAPDLESLFKRLAPAHTLPVFNYV